MLFICDSKLTIIGSDNGLLPGWHQAIIWTNARILLIGPLGKNFDDILIEVYTFSLKKMHLKMLSGKWRPFCPGLNVITHWGLVMHIYMCLPAWSSLVQVMAWCLTGVRPLPESMLIVSWALANKLQWNFNQNMNIYFWNIILNDNV